MYLLSKSYNHKHNVCVAYIVRLYPECPDYIITAAVDHYFGSLFTLGRRSWSMLKLHINPLNAILLIMYYWIWETKAAHATERVKLYSNWLFTMETFAKISRSIPQFRTSWGRRWVGCSKMRNGTRVQICFSSNPSMYLLSKSYNHKHNVCFCLYCPTSLSGLYHWTAISSHFPTWEYGLANAEASH